jgi:hypothetical protein
MLQMKWPGTCCGCAIAFVAAMLLGCDERSGSRPPGYTETDPSQSSKSTTAPARPTTQELIEGPYKKLSLFPLALSVSAPQSWAVSSPVERLYFLQGPAPSGGSDVQIQLAERTSETRDRLERLFRAAQRDAAAHADVASVEVRQLGDMRVFDVRHIVDGADPYATTSSAAPTSAASPPKLVDWSVTYYVPRGSDFAAYELHFFNLPKSQFDADKEFLRKILDSASPNDNGLGVPGDVK